MDKKKFLLISVLVVFLVGLGLWVKEEERTEVGQAGEVDQGRQTGEIEKVSLVLDFGEGKISTYSAKIKDSTTVWEVLSRVAKENDFNLVSEDSDFGVFIKEIGGKANTKDQFWLYFVNGKMGEVAADKYELKTGDLVEWKYEK